MILHISRSQTSLPHDEFFEGIVELLISMNDDGDALVATFRQSARTQREEYDITMARVVSDNGQQLALYTTKEYVGG